MEIGLIGLGKMGGNMVKRLRRDGHEVVGFDLKKENRKRADKDGARTVESLEKLVGHLSPPRAVWVMVPHGDPTRETIQKLLDLLEQGDLVVDGGNSHYTDSQAVAAECRKRGVCFLDAGVSGGIWGLEVGYNLMVGGEEEDFRRLEPVLRTLAPENGYAHVGPTGAGHFVKMIHNALEYGMLQAIGEAFECMERSEFDVDLKQVANLWQNGAVVRCWLLELLARAFGSEGNALEKIKDYVDDSETGRWTTDYAVRYGIPTPVITLSLYERFASRQEASFSAKVIATLRNQFGGHGIKEAPHHE